MAVRTSTPFAAVLALASRLSGRARGSAVVAGATVVTRFARGAPLEPAGRLTEAAVPKRRPAAAPPAHDEVPAPVRMLLHHVVSRRGPPVGLRLL
ncbi:hypothetical protein ACFV80_22585 [Streptomyces sp. NPDC059862]